MNVGLLHYSGPPIVGGVEQTIYFHSLGLVQAGHRPVLILGQGEEFHPQVEVRLIPELFSRHPEVLAVKAELDQGQVSARFHDLQRRISTQLRAAVQDLSTLIVHNALTLHKNLALTAALHLLNQEPNSPALIGWHHDFAWDREGYRQELHEGEPWDLLRRPWPGVTQVVVSAAQQQRLASLLGSAVDSIRVIPPGFEPALAGRWTDQVRKLVSELGLMQADLVLLLPARITRRKNIEFAVRVLAALRSQSWLDVRLLVSGPLGPHNPANLRYLEELQELRDRLSLGESLHLLAERQEPDLSDESMAALYWTCDALLFPSREEGFGIPMLEAGYARMPIFCSDIPPFRESGGENTHFFALDEPADAVAARILALLTSDAAYCLRKRVRRRYPWQQIISEKLLPLLKESQHG